MAENATPRLLIITQVVDAADPPLGFFHAWIKEFSKVFPQVSVICLRRGVYDLPGIPVYSLGKESGTGKLARTLRFYTYIWSARHDYDAVFVHMNQEYILLAGMLWKLMGKRVYMWRNHYAGSFLTDIAAMFCTKVFCTSKYSYTAKYKKTNLMPVGVDLSRFSSDGSVRREPRSILFLARMAPSKRVDLFIDALGTLLANGVSFTAAIYGSPYPADAAYYQSLKGRAESLGLHNRLQFHAGIANEDTPAAYHAHEFFVNCSRSGMFDKTLFEAAACGCLVLAASRDFADLCGPEFSFEEGSAESLAERLRYFLDGGEDERRAAVRGLAHAVQSNSLSILADRLAEVTQ